MENSKQNIDFDKSLQQKVESAFQFALDQTKGYYPLKKFHRVLKDSYQMISTPMRVAIAGEVSAGKSTFMNAVLGEQLVPTGELETTFNVNIFKYGNAKKILVHYGSENETEEKSFTELRNLIQRGDRNEGNLEKIDHVEIIYPSEVLKIFDLIDTPGLNSAHQNDSQNTKNFLQLYSPGKTIDEITKADAIIYLFQKNIAEEEISTIKDFQKYQKSPINSIGVLSKVDVFASEDRRIQDPVIKAKEIAENLLKEKGLDKIFYSILPICAQLAIGIETLQDCHWQTIEKLGQLERTEFSRLTVRRDRFIKDKSNISHKDREELVDKLSLYGIKTVYNILQSGVKEKEEIKKCVREKSGLPELLDLIKNHFGNRAFLIKLEKAIKKIQSFYFQERNRLQGEALILIEEISSQFSMIYTEERAFCELQVLKQLYQEKLEFGPEMIREIEQITGERGISYQKRLGLENGASIEEMISVAQRKVTEWYERSGNLLVTNRATLEAAKVVARSYEHLLYHLSQSQRL